MASGLESIALAVAHLESKNVNLGIGDDSNSSDKEPTKSSSVVVSEEDTTSRPATTIAIAAPPPSQAPPPITMAIPAAVRFGGKSGPRVVSMDGHDSAAVLRSVGVTTSVVEPTRPTKTPKSGERDSALVVGTTEIPPAMIPSSTTSGPSAGVAADAASSHHHADTVSMILQMDGANNFPPIPSPGDVIYHVLENDVLCGRGGETNHHTGNKRYREMVKACQPAYLIAKRREKPRIAKGIVLAVRKVGGRFLKKDPNTSTWRDVGNIRAREKTSQALREGAPEMRNTMVSAGGENPDIAVSATTQDLLINAKRKVDFPGSSAVQKRPNPVVEAVAAGPATNSAMTLPSSSSEAAQQTVVAMIKDDVTEPAAKRRRSSANGTVVSLSPTPSQVPSFLTQSATVPAADADAHEPCKVSDSCETATSAAAAVSGDDDDENSKGDLEGTGCKQMSTDRSFRGPRIKLLKKRLLEDTE